MTDIATALTGMSQQNAYGEQGCTCGRAIGEPHVHGCAKFLAYYQGAALRVASFGQPGASPLPQGWSQGAVGSDPARRGQYDLQVIAGAVLRDFDTAEVRAKYEAAKERAASMPSPIWGDGIDRSKFPDVWVGGVLDGGRALSPPKPKCHEGEYHIFDAATNTCLGCGIAMTAWRDLERTKADDVLGIMSKVRDLCQSSRRLFWTELAALVEREHDCPPGYDRTAWAMEHATAGMVGIAYERVTQ